MFLSKGRRDFEKHQFEIEKVISKSEGGGNYNYSASIELRNLSDENSTNSIGSNAETGFPGGGYPNCITRISSRQFGREIETKRGNTRNVDYDKKPPKNQQDQDFFLWDERFRKKKEKI